MSSLEIRVVDKYYLNKGDKIVLNKYEIGDKIGQGSHSIVYAVLLNTIDVKKVRSIKVENQKVRQPQISKEVSIVKKIFADEPAVVGFPKLYQYGFQNDFNYMVMRMLGPNLGHLHKVCGGVFSMKTTLILGLQILDRIQKIHNLGYLYVDMKPQNFLTGLGQDSVFIYMVDFGKCMLYKNKKNGNHIPYKQSQTRIQGQINFCSINCHNGIQYSRRDDIEAFFYMLIFFLKGNLPWDGIQSKSRSDRIRKVAEMKKKVTPQSLSKSLNIHLADLIWYARTLSFYERPDYEYIRYKLFSGFGQGQFDQSLIVYDWNNSQQLSGVIFSGTSPKITLVQQIAADLNYPPKQDPFLSIGSRGKGIENQRANSVLKKNGSNDTIQRSKKEKKSVKIEQTQKQKAQTRISSQKPKKGIPTTTIGRQLDFNS